MSKIYFDVTSLMVPNITGVGVYTKHLFYGLKEAGCPLFPVYKLSRWSKRGFIEKHINEKAQPFLPIFHRQGLLHGTDFKLLSASSEIKKVLTVHDLAIYREDLLDIHFCRQGQQKLESELAKKPEAVIVPTEFIQREFVERFPQYDGKTHAIHHGCDHIQNLSHREETAALGNYFLYVGRLERRKNVTSLIAAFDLFCEEGGEAELIIVGSDGFAAHEVKERVEQSAFKERISMRGYVGNQELESLYAKALAFVYPSHYEGFGIPIIEAMKMGVPVLTSNFGAMKEVGGEGALLVDPSDRSAFSEALHRLSRESEEKEKLKARGLQRATELTWKNSAEKTFELYRSL